MTHKTRLEKLEKAIKPAAKAGLIGSFDTRDYKDQAELDKAIDKWDRDNISPEVKRGKDNKVIYIIHDAGFKGWVWDNWEREFVSPGEFERRKKKMFSRYGEDYGREATQWGEGYIEGESKDD